MAKDLPLYGSSGLAPPDCAWAAGFFEGEGSVAFRPARHGCGKLLVEISQVDPVPLHHLKSIWGGQVYSKRRKAGSNWRDFSRWMVVSRDAMTFLVDISPYIIRPMIRSRISLAVAFQREKAVGGGSRSAAYRLRMQTFMQQMAELNRRGLK